MTIYNLFPLLVGHFSNWPQHLRRAADMGFGWIFVNPIQYSGFSGSLYSISDYFRWHPLLVDDEDPREPFLQSQAVIESGERLGLRFMTDLVTNHCAFDSPLVREHPEWLEWEGGKVVHPHCYEGNKKIVWGDLAKFRYDERAELGGLIDYWIRVASFLVEQGFQGFRCDAAYQVPDPVWSQIIGAVKKAHPEVIFVAESLGCTLEQTLGLVNAGVDFIQNSSKWWNFHDPWLMEQYDLTRELVGSIGFPESHDTPRLAAELDGNFAGLKQRYLFSALFSTGVMIPIGYEFGFRRPLHVVDTRPTDWEATDVDLSRFIESVNEVKRQHPTFHREVATQFIATGNPRVLLMRKSDRETGESSLVLLNTDIRQHQHFWCPSLYGYLGVDRKLVDVSPEFRLDYLPSPFEYDLRPGQGIVLVTE
ncbi:MAG: Alpha-1,4-glucan:maltose-1-phosphate maltosyltransferase [Verrucomicrobia subdivision 3 bacterium]|nr:Alpha-1,4-glucan:maltose-1-phosphate maltosyltransferase [Limisphaerales bacterium]MCS1412582.1 Alpha-1,4-glucan:maltose-1-phosphate maltosyltransferase [Limisphaerales bacterium]